MEMKMQRECRCGRSSSHTRPPLSSPQDPIGLPGPAWRWGPSSFSDSPHRSILKQCIRCRTRSEQSDPPGVLGAETEGRGAVPLAFAAANGRAVSCSNDQQSQQKGMHTGPHTPPGATGDPEGAEVGVSLSSKFSTPVETASQGDKCVDTGSMNL